MSNLYKYLSYISCDTEKMYNSPKSSKRWNMAPGILEYFSKNIRKKKWLKLCITWIMQLSLLKSRNYSNHIHFGDGTEM